MLWPEVILSKLIDDDTLSDERDDGHRAHTNDPASLTAQGSAGNPVVIIQGITLLLERRSRRPLRSAGQPDTLFNTVAAQGIAETTTFVPDNSDKLLNADGTPHVFQQDHLTVGLRPVVICFNHLFDNPPAVDPRGTLVTPQSGAPQANFAQGSSAPRSGPVRAGILNNATAIQKDSSGNPNAAGLTGQQTRFQVTNLVNAVQYGCLPKGRYAINIVYPDGQAWTVPNEAGACSGSEGSSDYTNLTCTIKPRPLLLSQGNRAVVEIVGPANKANCQGSGPPAGTTISADAIPAGSPSPAVPAVCLPVPPSQ